MGRGAVPPRQKGALMRKATHYSAKLIVTVESDKRTRAIKTTSVFDNRTQEHWTEEKIRARGIETFLDVDDLKATLNWNLNGDTSKYQFAWGQSGKISSEGQACIFQ